MAEKRGREGDYTVGSIPFEELIPIDEGEKVSAIHFFHSSSYPSYPPNTETYVNIHKHPVIQMCVKVWKNTKNSARCITGEIWSFGISKFKPLPSSIKP